MNHNIEGLHIIDGLVPDVDCNRFQRATLANGLVVTAEKHAHINTWGVRTHNSTERTNDVIADGVTLAEAEVVVSVLMDGGTRNEARAAGMALANA